MNIVKTALIVTAAIVLVLVGVSFALDHRAAGPEASAPSEDVVVEDAQTQAPALSTTKIGWGPGTNHNDRNQTVDSVAAQEKYEQLGGYFIFPEDTGVIYLTFDLGYENGYTEKILDTLREKNVKATFFITMDYAKEAPDIVRRIIDEGHTLGNHTVKHPSIPTVSDARVRAELMDLHDYVLDNFGYTMRLFRYPMGEFSEHTLSLINTLGYKSIFWSFAYKDWITDDQPDESYALQRTTDYLADGSIYLLHAVSATNAAIMGDLVDAARSRGFEFGLIDARLGLVETAQREESIL
ncbi:MAG: polysaccharide deacetylase family protein [Oscillospiraceae bacterium]|nr:polysaccharide deacetylase family protein [Oscillospiraceae bacterium]